MCKGAKIPLLKRMSQVMTTTHKRTTRASLLGCLFLLIYTPGLHAYLDPSTGSMIVSALVGIFASIALALKTYWYKLKSLFRRSKSSEESSVD